MLRDCCGINHTYTNLDGRLARLSYLGFIPRLYETLPPPPHTHALMNPPYTHLHLLFYDYNEQNSMQLNEAQEEIMQRRDKADKMAEATAGATQMVL